MAYVEAEDPDLLFMCETKSVDPSIEALDAKYPVSLPSFATPAPSPSHGRLICAARNAAPLLGS